MHRILKAITSGTDIDNVTSFIDLSMVDDLLENIKTRMWKLIELN